MMKEAVFTINRHDAIFTRLRVCDLHESLWMQFYRVGLVSTDILFMIIKAFPHILCTHIETLHIGDGLTLLTYIYK